ncbi:hypothetical protein EVAR_86856_1 [Eumeta japonica]|uniref:Uncharacterized protein n=1 Tax=Eumeta variegata TaxID=151549 RepID=A0A4C1VRX5_EUMVA|nr:hypothetical protein EVAR_86856_1 [Eumeta japonica]
MHTPKSKEVTGALPTSQIGSRYLMESCGSWNRSYVASILTLILTTTWSSSGRSPTDVVGVETSEGRGARFNLSEKLVDQSVLPGGDPKLVPFGFRSTLYTTALRRRPCNVTTDRGFVLVKREKKIVTFTWSPFGCYLVDFLRIIGTKFLTAGLEEIGILLRDRTEKNVIVKP